MALDSFPLFPALPAEVRLLIWQACLPAATQEPALYIWNERFGKHFAGQGEPPLYSRPLMTVCARPPVMSASREACSAVNRWAARHGLTLHSTAMGGIGSADDGDAFIRPWDAVRDALYVPRHSWRYFCEDPELWSCAFEATTGYVRNLAIPAFTAYYSLHVLGGLLEYMPKLEKIYVVWGDEPRAGRDGHAGWRGATGWAEASPHEGQDGLGGAYLGLPEGPFGIPRGHLYPGPVQESPRDGSAELDLDAASSPTEALGWDALAYSEDDKELHEGLGQEEGQVIDDDGASEGAAAHGPAALAETEGEAEEGEEEHDDSDSLGDGAYHVGMLQEVLETQHERLVSETHQPLVQPLVQLEAETSKTVTMGIDDTRSREQICERGDLKMWMDDMYDMLSIMEIPPRFTDPETGEVTLKLVPVKAITPVVA